MGYVYCAPARIRILTMGNDNIASGVLDIEGTEFSFRTRKHIVQATNKHYAQSAWKPRTGDLVLIDGDMGRDTMIVDHIEPDIASDQPVEHELLDQLQAKLLRMATATKHLRIWKPNSQDRGRWRLRWADPVTKCAELPQVDRAAFLHGIWDGFFQEWRLWITDADSGKFVVSGLPAPAEQLVAKALHQQAEQASQTQSASPSSFNPQPSIVPNGEFDLSTCPF